MSNIYFAPIDGGTVTFSASTTTSDEAIKPGCYHLQIHNTTNGVAFVKTANASALSATSADFPVAAGDTAIMRMSSSGHTIAAVILAAGATSGSVYLTPGSA